MRVVIAGGTGMLGRPLVAALVAQGDEVIVLSRNPEKVRGLPAGARCERWDGRTADGWGQLVEGAAVVNLAGENIGEGRWTAEKKRRIRDSRLQAGAAVLAAVEAAKEKPLAVVQASAIGYYGPTENEVDEDSPPGHDFLAEICVAWEASTAAVERLGVRRPVIRTGVVLAKDDGALPRMVLPFRLFAGGPIGDGRQWLAWIHRQDEIRAILALLADARATGPYNLCAPHPRTNAELAKALGQVLGRPSLLPVPAFALRIALGEMADVALTGQRAVPRRLSEMGFEFRFPTLEPALQDLLA